MMRPMITDHFLVPDRVAIVTGAGRGIGREHALMLAEHEIGRASCRERV